MCTVGYKEAKDLKLMLAKLVQIIDAVSLGFRLKIYGHYCRGCLVLIEGGRKHKIKINLLFNSL